MNTEKSHFMYTESEHGPQPENVYAPYFPPDVVVKCKVDFMNVMLRFRKQDIEFLKRALICGEVNGSLARKDFFGILAQSVDESREELEYLVKNSGIMSTERWIEYWCGQIIGPFCAEHKNGHGYGAHPCQFVEITIGWCDEAITELTLAEATQMRSP